MMDLIRAGFVDGLLAGNALATHVINDQAQLKRMSLNAKKIGRPRASLDVCDIILYYLKKQNDAQNKPQS